MNEPLGFRVSRWHRHRAAVTYALAAVAFVMAFVTRPRPAPFTVMPWLQDLWWLEAHVQRNDPNLSWAIETGIVDPPALHRVTVDAIRSARSEAQAERAIRRFVRAFHDGHFSVDRGEPPHSRQIERYFRGLPTRDSSAAYACSYFRFEEERGDDPAVPPSSAFPRQGDHGNQGNPGFEPLDGPAHFPAGIWTIGGRRLGILRIATFDTFQYEDACRRAWRGLRRRLAGPCGGDCEVALHSRTANALLAELSERARQMQLARVDALVLDLTGNPGGHGWARTAAEIFTRTPLPGQPVAFSRSESNVEEFREAARRIRDDLGQTNLDAASRELLEHALVRATALAEENRHPCDPGDIWSRFGGERPRERKLRCTNLTRTEYRSSGFLSLGSSHLPWQWQSEYDLSRARHYSAETGLYDGPLTVIVDRETGSAAELFAGQLQDWAGATVIGEHTAGAGGGWMMGDTPIVLPFSRLRVHLPDHATYRKDGSNGTAGVTPDVCVGWEPREGAEVRVRRLLRALRGL